MKKQISIIIAAWCVSAAAVSAQKRYDFRKNYPDTRMELSLGGEYLIGSESITVEFQNTFISNGFIGQEMKDESFGNMDDRSVAASRLNYGITFLKRKQDQPDNFWFASLKNRSHYDTKFTKDLFGLYFYGNKPYAGKTADMSDMDYQSIKWQQAQFGISRKLGGDSLRYWQITGSLSLLNGQEYLDFETGRGTFYTDPDAEYIEMDLYMESRQSDSSDYKFGSSNGFGASADLMLTYTIKDHSYLNFGFRDLGVIAWNSSSFKYTVDTLYRFEGAVTGGFFDSLFLDVGTEEDFVNSFIEEYESGGFTTMIPLWIGAEYGRELLDGKVAAFAGFDYLLNANYDPHFRLGGEYRFNKNIVAGTSFHMGGYANFGWELYGAFDLTGALILTAGTSYLGSIITPSSSTAQGAVFGLKKMF